MKVDINVQSISDIITNSSTEVFTRFKPSDKQAVKDLVNTILAINGEYVFDDLFTINMEISWYSASIIYENYDEINSKYNEMADFVRYLETLSDKELEPYEQMLWDCYDYSPKPLYSGIYVDIKEGITESEELKKAVGAISNLAYLFEYDYGEC